MANHVLGTWLALHFDKSDETVEERHLTDRLSDLFELYDLFEHN